MSKAPETLTAQESQQLLTMLTDLRGPGRTNRRKYRNYTMALLMLDAGLRVGEVCRLQVKDLLINNEPIRSLQLDSCLAEKSCTRLVPLSNRTIKAIQLMRDAIWTSTSAPPPSFAFYSLCPESPITTRQVQRIIADASWQAFGRRIHPHVLRHTFASRLMRVTSAPIIQELLGHKNLSSTQIYCHPNGDDLQAAIADIEEKPNKP